MRQTFEMGRRQQCQSQVHVLSPGRGDDDDDGEVGRWEEEEHYGPNWKKHRKNSHPITVPRTSERTSEWPSTLIWIPEYFGPQREEEEQGEEIGWWKEEGGVSEGRGEGRR